jgi:crotonobetainyl-CoA:carnitine CoA-transferase CaiB-like acyl-CoA transferase
LAGPFVGTLLADLGADVIRVEGSAGSDDRNFGYPAPGGSAFAFCNANRNKKGISLNFEKNAKAREILFELVKRCDVVSHNFSLKATEALGVAYDDIKAVKPDIIYAHVTGFGLKGPYKDRIGFDPMIKAMSGIMSITGPPGPPSRDLISYIDFGTAMLATIGVVCALRHRDQTGRGQMIDTALFQTAVTYCANAISAWETLGVRQPKTGSQAAFMGPSDVYRTKDGKYVLLAVITNPIWKRFCRFIGREDLATDPKYRNDFARWNQREVLDPLVAEWVASQTAEEIEAVCQKIPIPCGICLDHTEVAEDPQVKALEMLTKLPAPDGSGDVLVANIPLRMSETPLKIERSFPGVGQHNEEVFGNLLGYSREDLARLKEEGVV